eukprot:Platyproteum_vivax@DN37_c0_g1_i1.p1
MNFSIRIQCEDYVGRMRSPPENIEEIRQLLINEEALDENTPVERMSVYIDGAKKAQVTDNRPLVALWKRLEQRGGHCVLKVVLDKRGPRGRSSGVKTPEFQSHVKEVFSKVKNLQAVTHDLLEKVKCLEDLTPNLRMYDNHSDKHSNASPTDEEVNSYRQLQTATDGIDRVLAARMQAGISSLPTFENVPSRDDFTSQQTPRITVPPEHVATFGRKSVGELVQDASAANRLSKASLDRLQSSLEAGDSEDDMVGDDEWREWRARLQKELDLSKAKVRRLEQNLAYQLAKDKDDDMLQNTRTSEQRESQAVRDLDDFDRLALRNEAKNYANNVEREFADLVYSQHKKRHSKYKTKSDRQEQALSEDMARPYHRRDLETYSTNGATTTYPDTVGTKSSTAFSPESNLYVRPVEAPHMSVGQWKKVLHSLKLECGLQGAEVGATLGRLLGQTRLNRLDMSNWASPRFCYPYKTYLDGAFLNALLSELPVHTVNKLKFLELSNCRLVDEPAAEALARLFATCADLEELNLQGYEGSLVDVTAVLRTFPARGFNNLTSLNMSYCGMESLGTAELLGDFIGSCPRLRNLQLQGNHQFSTEAFIVMLEKVLECAKRNHTPLRHLKHFNISKCRLRGAKGGEALGAFVRLCPHLETLLMDENLVGVEGFEEMVRLMQIDRLTRLRVLSISYCGLESPYASRILDKIFKLAPALTELNWDDMNDETIPSAKQSHKSGGLETSRSGYPISNNDRSNM